MPCQGTFALLWGAHEPAIGGSPGAKVWFVCRGWSKGLVWVPDRYGRSPASVGPAFWRARGSCALGPCLLFTPHVLAAGPACV